MGASTGDPSAFDGGATALAGLARSPVNRGHPSVVAVNAFKVSEVTEGCSANSNAALQDVNEAVAEGVQA